MIERVWHGWAKDGQADAYAAFLRDEFLPAAHTIPGYLGARVLKRLTGDEWEFIRRRRHCSAAGMNALPITSSPLTRRRLPNE